MENLDEKELKDILNYEDEYTPAREALACMYVAPPKPVFNPEDYNIDF